MAIKAFIKSILLILLYICTFFYASVGFCIKKAAITSSAKNIQICQSSQIKLNDPVVPAHSGHIKNAVAGAAPVCHNEERA